MDRYLLEYISSGESWLMLGSGLSIAAGYPDWKTLAEKAINLTNLEYENVNSKQIQTAFDSMNYPLVFQYVSDVMGMPRLLEELRLIMKSSGKKNPYDYIARWPVPVYLTTNFDDDIQNSLSKLNANFLPYNNSPEHLGLLTSDLKGVIFKLHGDLRSEERLILTSSQYQKIATGVEFEFWRTKLTSIFQMQKLIIIGHSLTDINIKHVLNAAKQGSSINNPICWIAPDVPLDIKKKYLEDYRIRVISYDNKIGDHRNLRRLLENTSDFIPPRTSVRESSRIDLIYDTDRSPDSAAAGLYVFNKALDFDNFDEHRVDIILSTLIFSSKELESISPFYIKEALKASGWPKDVEISITLEDNIRLRGLEKGIFIEFNGKLILGENVELYSTESLKEFNHLKKRFINSIVFRIRREWPELEIEDVEELANNIQSSFLGFFKNFGLTVSSAILQKNIDGNKLPISVAKYINEASTKNPDLLHRQIFMRVSIEMLVRSEEAEREFLGRMSQGFFAYNLLGIFGEHAILRHQHLKETVWILDSSVQIVLLALDSAYNHVFASNIKSLKNSDIRLFTTEKLFQETYTHFWFANKQIQENGENSPDIIAAAVGNVPYEKSNLFLDGFVRSRAADRNVNWEEYCFKIFKHHKPKEPEVLAALESIGIEVVEFQFWPGFEQTDFNLHQERTIDIARLKSEFSGDINQSQEILEELTRKAKPESDAYIIVSKERLGVYNMLKDGKSDAWFISNTSMLNLLGEGKITWQPEAFLNFVATFFPLSSNMLAENAFEMILWTVAQSGLNLLSSDIIEIAFKGIIDQSKIDILEQKELYGRHIEEKYGEPIEDILERTQTEDLPTLNIQLSKEIIKKQEKQLETIKRSHQRITKESKQIKDELGKLTKYKAKKEKSIKRAKISKRRSASRKKK